MASFFQKGMFPVVVASVLAGCSSTGDSYRADVYSANQVNQVQEAKTIQLIAVMPARIEVSNENLKERAQIGGAIVGAILGGVVGGRSDSQGEGALVGGATGLAAGSMVNDKTLVDGVSLTYVFEGKTLNSAQVGRVCEYAPGLAVMISQSETETRIQPNAVCPQK